MRSHAQRRTVCSRHRTRPLRLSAARWRGSRCHTLSVFACHCAAAWHPAARKTPSAAAPCAGPAHIYHHTCYMQHQRPAAADTTKASQLLQLLHHAPNAAAACPRPFASPKGDVASPRGTEGDSSSSDSAACADASAASASSAAAAAAAAAAIARFASAAAAAAAVTAHSAAT